jgi:hypothetical protein
MKRMVHYWYIEDRICKSMTVLFDKKQFSHSIKNIVKEHLKIFQVGFSSEKKRSQLAAKNTIGI